MHFTHRGILNYGIFFNDYKEREKNYGIVLCNTHILPLDVQKTDVNRK